MSKAKSADVRLLARFDTPGVADRSQIKLFDVATP
jgi:hypothetical protein